MTKRLAFSPQWIVVHITVRWSPAVLSSFLALGQGSDVNLSIQSHWPSFSKGRKCYPMDKSINANQVLTKCKHCCFSKQGHLQPHPPSKAEQLITTVKWPIEKGSFKLPFSSHHFKIFLFFLFLLPSLFKLFVLLILLRAFFVSFF